MMRVSNCRQQLLAIICSAVFVQGTAAAFVSSSSSSRRSFGARTIAFTHVMHKRRNHVDSSRSSSLLQMSAASSLFSSSNAFFQKRMTTTASQYGDPLVNNRYSASDWLHNVFTLPRSSVLRDIRNPVITIALWSTLVSVVHAFLQKSSLPMIQKFASDMCIGGAPHSFLVSSLGLLLVFRTNSAYQRFNVSTA